MINTNVPSKKLEQLELRVRLEGLNHDAKGLAVANFFWRRASQKACQEMDEAYKTYVSILNTKDSRQDAFYDSLHSVYKKWLALNDMKEAGKLPELDTAHKMKLESISKEDPSDMLDYIHSFGILEPTTSGLKSPGDYYMVASFMYQLMRENSLLLGFDIFNRNEKQD